jgi:hypothetical protein
MRFKAVLIAVGAALAAISTVALAQSTKQPDAGESPAASQGRPGQGDQGRSPGETQDQRQAQPQGSTGPIQTRSGGAPAASPQGDTPAGMQATPQGSSEQSGRSGSSER